MNEFTKTVTVTKEALIDAHRHVNVEDPNWVEDPIRYWTEVLEKLGFSHVQIQHAGSLKADSVTGHFTRRRKTEVDAPDALKETIQIYFDAMDDMAHTLAKDLNKVHRLKGKDKAMADVEYSFGVEKIHASWSTRCPRVVSPEVHGYPAGDRLKDIMTGFIVSLNNVIYTGIEEHYAYLTSDEAVWDTLVQNDFFEWTQVDNS